MHVIKVLGVYLALCLGYVATYAQEVATEERADSIISCPYKKPPIFPGGESAFNTYITTNFNISKEAEEKAKSGVIRVQFSIEVDGSVSDVKVISEVKIGYGMEEEVVRLISSMPLWIFDQNSEIVKCTFQKPIKFTF